MEKQGKRNKNLLIVRGRNYGRIKGKGKEIGWLDLALNVFFFLITSESMEDALAILMPKSFH